MLVRNVFNLLSATAALMLVIGCGAPAEDSSSGATSDAEIQTKSPDMEGATE